ISELGESVTGRLSMQIRNFGFESLERGTVTLFAQGTPRFPVMNESGVVRQRFRIWHSEADPVEITGVRRFKQYQVGKATPMPPAYEEIRLADALPETTIPPGRGLELPFAFDFGVEPSVYSVTYRLEGVSADGKPAKGELSVLKPPPKPTREN